MEKKCFKLRPLASLFALPLVFLGVSVANASQGYYTKCGNGNKYNSLLVPRSSNKLYSNRGVCAFTDRGYTIFIVDLKSGARVDFGVLYSGSTRKFSPNYYKIPINEKLYKSQTIDTWLTTPYKAEAVINGQFFSMEKGNTFLSFPTKNAGNNFGSLISSGVDLRIGGENSESDFRTLVFYSDNTVTVKSYSLSDITSSNKLIVGFKHNYKGRDQNPNIAKTRTFAGVRSKDTTPRNNKNEFVVFAVSPSGANANSFSSVMSDWGISSSNLVMFDGGASSQYAYSNKKFTNSQRRPIPMVFRLIGN